MMCKVISIHYFYAASFSSTCPYSYSLELGVQLTANSNLENHKLLHSVTSNSELLIELFSVHWL